MAANRSVPQKSAAQTHKQQVFSYQTHHLQENLPRFFTSASIRTENPQFPTSGDRGAETRIADIPLWPSISKQPDKQSCKNCSKNTLGEQGTKRVRFLPGKSKDFSLCNRGQTGSRTRQASHPKGTGSSPSTSSKNNKFQFF